MDGDVPKRTSYGIYNLNLLDSPVRTSSNLSDFNCPNKALTTKLLRQGYRYFELHKALVGSLYANRFFFCISVLRVASEPRVKLAVRKFAFRVCTVCLNYRKLRVKRNCRYLDFAYL